MDGGASLKSVLGEEPILPNVDTGNSETIAERDEVLGGHWGAFGMRIERESSHLAFLGLAASALSTGSSTSQLTLILQICTSGTLWDSMPSSRLEQVMSPRCTTSSSELQVWRASSFLAILL